MARTCEVVRAKAIPAGFSVVAEAAPAVAKKAPAAVGPAAERAAVPGSMGATSKASKSPMLYVRLAVVPEALTDRVMLATPMVRAVAAVTVPALLLAAIDIVIVWAEALNAMMV